MKLVIAMTGLKAAITLNFIFNSKPDSVAAGEVGLGSRLWSGAGCPV